MNPKSAILIGFSYSQNSMHRLIRHSGYYPLTRSADKYLIGSHLTNIICIQNGHPLIPTSDTPGIYKGLECTRYPRERHSLQHVLRSENKELTVH